MMRMNESQASYVRDDVVVFAEGQYFEEDVLFECSSICLSPVQVRGRLTAQYDFRCVSILEVGECQINGGLVCLDGFECERAEVGRDLVVRGDIRAKELSVEGNIVCDNLYCEKLNAGGNVLTLNDMDTSRDIQICKNLLCLGGVVVDGSIQACKIIAGEYAEIHEAMGVEALVLAGAGPVQQQGLEAGMSEASLADLQDYNSPLASALEDVAVFVEALQADFASKSLKEELVILDTIASFFTAFAELNDRIRRAIAVCGNNDATIGRWHATFLDLANAVLDIPDWMRGSAAECKIMQEIERRMKTQCPTKSESNWGACLNAMLRLKRMDKTPAELKEKLERGIIQLFIGIGIKPSVVSMYLTEP